MPYKKTVKKAQKAKRAGKSASTQAGEFVKAEIDKIRSGKSGARNTKQAIAIGLSEARRAGVDLPTKGRKTSPGETKHTGRIAKYKTNAKRSKAATKRQKNESHNVVSFKQLSGQSKKAAKKRRETKKAA